MITVGKDLESFSCRGFRIRFPDFLHGRVGVQHHGAFVLGIKRYSAMCGNHGQEADGSESQWVHMEDLLATTPDMARPKKKSF
jgi:hypothetical protein